MDKMVNCRNWKEYQGLNGWTLFCSAGAFGRKLDSAEAADCGCTAAQRLKCQMIMESCVGFALVPEVEDSRVSPPVGTKKEPAMA